MPARMLDAHKLDLKRIFHLMPSYTSTVLKWRLKTKARLLKAVGLGVHKPEDRGHGGKNDPRCFPTSCRTSRSLR